ncbi:MAG: hypothetical protein KJ747_00740 [Actinobacteria bacterium]|nr:hypothetical protein [Actinomycetota bacterium]MCG2807264.1 hypothetical protein [Coriobacteriia bacterium]
MPVEWHLHVLEERLKHDFGHVFAIQAVDLYGVSLAEQTAAIDAMVETQGDFPITLVDGVVACVSEIDIDAIAAELGRRIESQSSHP